MKQLILDTNEKEIHLYLGSSVTEELHITSHWFDYYKTSGIKNLGNWNGFSDGTQPVIIVGSPSPVNCWKREVTSISVYNPNTSVVFAYIAEYDGDTGDTTIIDQIVLNPFGSRTLECICDSCNSCGGINVYDEGQIVYNNINNINFVGDCISSVYNPTTGHVDVMFSPILSWSGCEGESPYILSLCGTSVDLSCLAGSGESEIPVELATFIMENGDDSTGEVHRFDKPFRTLAAAITEGAVNIVMYAGEYSQTLPIILNEAFGNDTISIFAHPGVRFTGSFELGGDYVKLRIKGNMDWVGPAPSHPFIYINANGGNVNDPLGYKVDIEVNGINLSNTALYQESTTIKKFLDFSFKSNKSFLETGSYLDAKIITADSDEMYQTRNFNVSLGYLSVSMPATDTISMYQPLVYIYNIGENNNFRLYDTTLQEASQTVNQPLSATFGGNVYNKGGKIKNICKGGSRVLIDNVKIKGAFTANADFGGIFTSNAIDDESVSMIVFKNTIISLDKIWDSNTSYSIVNSIQTANVGLNYVTFEGVNTWFLPLGPAQTEFVTSLAQDSSNAPIAYGSSSGFLVTNLFFDISTVNIAFHGHGRTGSFDNKHIIFTGREPETYLFEPIIESNYSL